MPLRAPAALRRHNLASAPKPRPSSSTNLAAEASDPDILRVGKHAERGRDFAPVAVGVGGAAMKVTEQDVLHVADLANLELTPQERQRMVTDLNSILDYVDRLNELDTSGVEPMAQVSDRYGVDAAKAGSERFAYATREDVLNGLRKSFTNDEALQNAPETDGTFFEVPKVIER